MRNVNQDVDSVRPENRTGGVWPGPAAFGAPFPRPGRAGGALVAPGTAILLPVVGVGH